MSNEVNVAYVQQYSNNVELLLQQMGSKLRGAVMVNSYTGKAAKTVEQVGPVVAQERTSRHADTPLIETPHDARWVFPKDFEWADLIDDQDKVRMLIDPQSPYARNGAMALGRKMDDQIINAFFGTAKTGENGTTDTTHSGGNGQQIASGSAGLTIAKLRTAKKHLMAAEVDTDQEQLWCAITAEQHDDLLNETQMISLDYNSKPVLVDGKVSAFMGFNFIHTERLTTASSERRVPCWATSGMCLGIWNDINTAIDRRPDKSNATQVYVKGTFGATRIEEEKVVEILCAE